MKPGTPVTYGGQHGYVKTRSFQWGGARYTVQLDIGVLIDTHVTADGTEEYEIPESELQPVEERNVA